MPAGSDVSREMAVEIWTQAVSIARRLAEYVSSAGIGPLVPVNINSNHDFLCEGGAPASERAPGEEAGTRDHFYRNVLNTAFFDVIESLYPWNGDRWLQVNINCLQSAHLRDVDGGRIGSTEPLST